MPDPTRVTCDACQTTFENDNIHLDLDVCPFCGSLGFLYIPNIPKEVVEIRDKLITTTRKYPGTDYPDLSLWTGYKDDPKYYKVSCPRALPRK